MSRITVRQYEELWEAYLENPRLTHISRKCNIHMLTASRYVKKGDPARGLRPLFQRYQEYQDALQKQVDSSFVSMKQRAMEMVAQYLGRVQDKLDAITRDPSKLKEEQIPVALDKLIRLAAYIAGEEETRHIVRVSQDIPDEELTAILQNQLNAMKYVRTEKECNGDCGNGSPEGGNGDSNAE